LTVLAVLVSGGLFASAPAHAQQLTFPQTAPVHSKSTIEVERNKQKQMLVQANEINYDYTNKRVAAVGNVQIYYGSSTLEADKVI
jgi:LPS-assembly protein